MDLFDALYARRTIRKFASQPIERHILYKLIDCARISPSAANLQPIKYAVINDAETNSKIFPFLKWAGYEPKAAPQKGEEPTAYIAILGDDDISAKTQACDAGLAMSALCYAAVGAGLATCILGAIDREKLKLLLQLPENLHILYIVALGYPAQDSVPVAMTDSCKYYLNGETLYVPKRKLDDSIINYREE